MTNPRDDLDETSRDSFKDASATRHPAVIPSEFKSGTSERGRGRSVSPVSVGSTKALVPEQPPAESARQEEQSRQRLPFWTYYRFSFLAEPPSWLKIPVSTRLAAVKSLIASRDDRVPQILARLLHDHWVVVRQAAVSGIAMLRVKNLAAELCQLVVKDSSQEVRRTAAHALSHLKEVSGIGAILELAAEHPRSESVALEYIVRYGRLAITPLASCLTQRPKDHVAFVAIKALGQLASPQAGAVLLQHLFACPGEWRLSILKALNQCDLPEVGLRVAPLLADSSTEIRGATLELMCRHPPRGAAHAVIKQLKCSDANLRAMACRVLRNEDSATVLSPLLEALRDPASLVRRAAAESLAEIESSAAIRPLLAALHTDDVDTLAAVVKALGDLGAVDALPGIVPLLHHEQQDIRKAAATALGLIGETDSVDSLIAALSNEPNEHVLQAVVRALGQIGDPKALPVLEAILVEASPLRLPAVVAIASIGSTAAKQILIPLTADHSGQVRYHAVMALCQDPKDDVIPALERTVESATSTFLYAMARTLKLSASERGRQLGVRAEALARKREVTERIIRDQSSKAVEAVTPSRQSPFGYPANRWLLSGAVVVVALLIVGVWFWSAPPFAKSTPQVSLNQNSATGQVIHLGTIGRGELLTMTSNGDVSEWLPSGKSPSTSKRLSMTNVVSAVSSGNGDKVALANSLGEIRVFDYPSGQEVLRVPGRGLAIRKMWFNRLSTAFAAWSPQDGIRGWDLETKEPILEYVPPQGEQWHAADLASDFGKLVIAPQGGQVTLINLVKGRVLGFLGQPNSGGGLALKFSFENELIAAASSGGKVTVFDSKSRRAVQEFSTPLSAVRSLEFSKTGETLFGGGVGGVFQGDVRTGSVKGSTLEYRVKDRKRVSELESVTLMALDGSSTFLFGGTPDSHVVLKWKLPLSGPAEELGQ